MRHAPTVLLLSDDTLAAALLGLLAEAAGYAPAFAKAGEEPVQALERVRPLFVVLVDSSLEAARSDLFFGRAARRRVGLAIVRLPGHEDSLAPWADDRDVPLMDLPTNVDQFSSVVQAAAASNWWRSRKDRRRSPRAERAADGVLVYVDRAGQRWQVYDRRSSERRRAAMERIFVGEHGEAFACAIDADASEPRGTELERQLARATRIVL
jgi:CheY-like chemotaxis protein